MHILNKLLAGALTASICMTASAASGTTNTTESNTVATQAKEPTNKEKAAFGICNIVVDGVFNIAAMRQDGISQSDAQSQFKKASDALVKEFGDDEVTSFIKEFWQHGLKEIYKEQIEQTDDKKQNFVHAASADAAHACLDILLGNESKANTPNK